MAEDPTLDTSTGSPEAERNGAAHDIPYPRERDVVRLRARCSNLRHSCRTMLEDPAAAGVLPEATAAELRTTAPEVSEAEGQTVISLLARGGNVPPNHPLAPASIDPPSLRADFLRLTAEVERLRQALFTLFDYLHPEGTITEEELLKQREEGPSVSISDIIAEFERELGEHA